MPDPFITTQDLSDLLGRDVTADNGAVMAIDAACDVVRDITEQDFNAGTTTITLDGSGTGKLVRGTAGVWQAAMWPLGRQNVRVTYEHGYQPTDVPRSIRIVALQL